jgi:hypothetical protein
LEVVLVRSSEAKKEWEVHLSEAMLAHLSVAQTEVVLVRLLQAMLAHLSVA